VSRLAARGRPWVSFDPANREHRKWYAEFERSGTWGRCPVRFSSNEDHGNLLAMIRSQLIEYYVKREFNNRNGV
jgi:hypothetical protein